jgi:hypothetical protein
MTPEVMIVLEKAINIDKFRTKSDRQKRPARTGFLPVSKNTKYGLTTKQTAVTTLTG